MIQNWISFISCANQKRRRMFLIVLLVSLSSLLSCAPTPVGSLLIAFPAGDSELRVVFSEPLDRLSAEQPESYTTETGLNILSASLDPNDPKRVTLETEPMNGKAMQIDILRSPGVRTASGAALANNESPKFIQGIASIAEIQKPANQTFPFASRFEGVIASASCVLACYPDAAIDVLGFNFLQEEKGGPFTAIKIVSQKHVPGFAEADSLLPDNLSVHVLWSGGIIQTIDGETRLVDNGFMEGSIIEPNPLKSPTPYPIKSIDISGEAGKTLRAKSLLGVVVQLENVTIDSVSAPDEEHIRSFSFHDDSGELAIGLALQTVTRKIEPGQTFELVRGIIHQPKPGEYELLVVKDQNLMQSRP